MNNSKSVLHNFHIPVMGLGYTIDTPAKVAKYGISSVVSIIEDHLVEEMREFYCKEYNYPYTKIETDEDDYRARRITAYLDLLHDIVIKQFNEIVELPFGEENDLTRYFKLLPDNSPLKNLYLHMLAHTDQIAKQRTEHILRGLIKPGSIDVNIMTKCDRPAQVKDGVKLPDEYSDALSALRGFAKSKLSSSIVFSAGLNPRLYSYCATFKDFLPDANGFIKKKIILKVSDYRSALIQGKFLASKGLWISEFRIESGLNCGGHAFATDGYLLGPILAEFNSKRDELHKIISEVYLPVIKAKVPDFISEMPVFGITVQGGIGTHQENDFLLNHYKLQGTGWGSPFLLVPEATNVDENTLKALVNAKPEDYYLSHASPLGIPLNNFRNSSSEEQRKERIRKNRPGSPCYKKFLSFNSEFGKDAICTASRQYQELKINEIKSLGLTEEEYAKQYNDIIEKDCLCEGLGASALLKNNLKLSHKLSAVSICPGPNLAYFSKLLSLEDMIDHIYGRANVLNNVKRKHVFINELEIYIKYLKEEIERCKNNIQKKKLASLQEFKENLKKGIDYYYDLLPALKKDLGQSIFDFQNALINCSKILYETPIPQINA